MQPDEKVKYKNELISKLYTIWKDNTIPLVYRQWLQQVARYINKMEGNR